MANFKINKSEILFRGKVFDLKVEEIEYESGNKGVRETAVHGGGAVILPVKNNGKLIMIKQYRHPLQKIITEFPAGKLNKDEGPYDCAVRELTEETGYKAGFVKKLGAICTTPGFCTEILHIYIAKDLAPGNHNREEGEYGMEVFELDKEEIKEKINLGDIFDAKTICGFYMAVSSGLI